MTPDQTAANTAPAAFVCRNCRSSRSRVRYAFAGVDVVIRECLSCSLMVLDPLPTEDDLRAVYNEGYFKNEDLAHTDVTKVYGYIDYISERVHKQRGYADVCRTLGRLIQTPRQAPKLLDIGCGLGFFLDTAFEFGFDVHGVEFNDHAIEYVRRRYTHRVTSMSELNPNERYDVVTMFDVIEHLREPFSTLDDVRNLLEDNGLVVIVTMDSKSVVSRIMGKRLEDFRRIREHLFFFSRKNLVEILDQRGFDVVTIASRGHSFEVGLLAARLRTVLPIVGTPLCWLVGLFPFIQRAGIYVNPRTKFIVYARKRPRPASGTSSPPDRQPHPR